ncbi:fucose permease [Paraburkholderia sp. BL6669N2]|uniref:MFS transporter n=1 Tax=Paraburkholderia sp. BL6669N2 TaxID=1938807 RepID=UPI000E255AD5|nr:MFS transporter [Paraburkholderia sp. BL6669N2]REG60823.1 fucose permease [Paraburkholderia sp. BL6669N2]
MTACSFNETRSSVTVWQQHATRAAFFAAGFAVAAWAPLVPFVKNRLAINDATLGCLLLCLGVGSILAMVSSGSVVSRFGCRRVINLSMLAAAVMLSLLGSVSGILLTGVVLALFGGAIGTMDVAMNVHAIAVEQGSGRRMMSGFHALYSIGGLAGAGGAAAALSAGIAPGATAIGAASALIIALVIFGRHFLSDKTQAHGSSLVVPRGSVLLLGSMCLMLLLVEGAMLDWSALLLSGSKAMPEAQAGIGYAVFAGTMTAMRLTGDWTAAKLGARRVVRLGSALGAIGVALAVFTPDPYLTIFGFALMGVGCANVVPILYSAAGADKSMPSEHAIAATATLGYAGTLTGPAAIGFIAHGIGLSAAFGLLAALLLIVCLASNIVPKHEQPDALS